MRIVNIHVRRLPGAPESVGALLDSLAGPDDRLWPVDRWPPMRFNGPLDVGARGGHGPVRYQVRQYVAGQRLEFQFDPERGLLRGFEGWHAFEIACEQGQAVLRHVLEARCGLAAAVRWFLMVRPLHDALIEDALDRAETALGGRPAKPARWTTRVRILRWLARRRPGQSRQP